MGWIQMQMVDGSVQSDWWKELIRHFVSVGDELEIRCWKEETAEVQHASIYGEPSEDGYEVSVKGVVTPQLFAELLAEEPVDKEIYNKMTKYFTVRVRNASRTFSSEHYGTEIYANGASDDLAFISNVMEPYGNRFSIGAGE